MATIRFFQYGVLLFWTILLPRVEAAGNADPLADLVTIYRDHYGVPHIVGETEEATFFGYGRAQAEDHLERMMLQYRDARGTRAEVLGFDAIGDNPPRYSPHDYRWGGDYLQRLMRTKQCVVDHKDKIDPHMYRILDAFARGVNHYIAEHRAELPGWIDRVTAEDVEALERSHYMRFYSVGDALNKLKGLREQLPNFGSNQWAISAEKSANGRIIHVEHTHMPWENRFQNYEAHLMTPGKLDAAGISWFGSPVFLDGLNQNITWSATWNQPNLADIYEEKINPDNPRQYLYEGAWRDMRVETEVFRFRDGQEIQAIRRELFYTHHGPVVQFDKERLRAYAVKVPNYEGVNYTLGLYGIMQARNLGEFQAAVARQLMPRWNLLYTDAQNIYWVHNGNVARRSEKYDWHKPVPGWTKETEWGEYLPFEAYPQLLNPRSGFLQNCNNPFWVATKNSGLNPLEPAPYYLSHPVKAGAGEEVLNPRGERLFQVLSRDKKFTLREMTELGFDTRILAADVAIPLLERAFAAKKAGADARLSRAMKLLRAWDRRSAKDSAAFTYFFYWSKAYQEMFPQAKFSRFLSYSRTKIEIESAAEQEMAWKALESAVDRIRKKYGRAEVPWGKINVVVRGGVFPVGGNGTFDVLHPDEGPEQADGRIHCNDGWGHLLIVMEGQPKQVWSLLPYGQSEHPKSRHYNDQTKLHSQGRVKRLWLAPGEILAQSESVWGDRNRMRRLFPAAPAGR